jgi:type I restriction enzyme R subunit
MSSKSFAEFIVEQTLLVRLESLGYAIRHGSEIAPVEPGAERNDYQDSVRAQRLRDALLRKSISGELRRRGAACLAEARA